MLKMKDNGKKIDSIWIRYNDCCIATDAATSLYLEISYYGDRNEIWVVQINNSTGQEIARYNYRYIIAVLWEE
jgi:hypothetical protein